MSKSLLAALVLAAAAPLAAQSGPAGIERGIVEEMNLARTNPRQYAAFLRAMLPSFSGNLVQRPGQPGLMTQEGPRAVEEAIAFLERQGPLAPLAASAGLSAAARDHARDQAGGATGHAGSDGSDMAARISRYGRWDGSAAENIAYGPEDARDVVLQLIVDDGVPSRGHRTNIFAAQTRFAGAGCGSHARFRTVCVIDYAGGYTESGGAPAAAPAAPTYAAPMPVSPAPAPMPMPAPAKGLPPAASPPVVAPIDSRAIKCSINPRRCGQR